MLKEVLVLAPILILTVISCGTTRQQNDVQKQNFERGNDITSPDHAISLEDHLSRVPGVQVSGSGNSARVRIRGVSSLNSGNDPLFIVNGQQINGGFGALRDAAPVHEIKSIRVLKDPSETAFYGVRGSNGVIVITLK
ncbi:MAG: TonB-dependent receptor plug domain-containing protein [Saprospiraceae bacterium]|jgi:TonB-dependent SusC/RagA subfamily outer membrane receptor|nr:TonB-dependent receptor plug domain-containing protein [Saprospiraceae bacterium]